MYQSVDDESCDSLPETRPARNKGPSRCYNATMIVVYFVLLIITVVALGTYGVKEGEFIKFVHRQNNATDLSCVLYSTYAGQDKDGNEPHSSGLCGYVFWGLTSVTIVVFVWLVNSIFQTFLGPTVLSLLRVLDLIVMLLSCFFSLALSATIDAGLTQTCNAFLKHADKTKYSTCYDAYFTGVSGQTTDRLSFYDVLSTTKTSSWVTTVVLAGLSVWYTVMVVSYCCVLSQRRRRRREALINDCDSDCH